MNDDATPAKVRLTDRLGGWVPPPGWTVEEPEWLPDCVVIGNRLFGWVTVDMKARFFGAGIGKPRRWSGLENSPGFVGKGWQRRIMDAAEEHLRACNSAA
jgi:hypothetical protein